MLPKVKEDTLARLAKVAGQIRGIQKMVEEDKYCIDVLHQVAAARAALDKIGLAVLKGHVATCVTSAVNQGQGQEYIDELEKALAKFL